jgi:hypothetical protein
VADLARRDELRDGTYAELYRGFESWAMERGEEDHGVPSEAVFGHLLTSQSTLRDDEASVLSLTGGPRVVFNSERLRIRLGFVGSLSP